MTRSSIVQLMTVIGTLATFARPAAAGAQPEATGEVLYKQHCASCHDGSVPRAPARASLAGLSQDALQFALTTGSMKAQASSLTATERSRLISYLSAGCPSRASSSNACAAGSSRFEKPLARPHWNGWGVDLSQSRFQPAAMARLEPRQVSTLSLKWAFGFPDVLQMYGQPTVVGGRVFVGSAGRKVY